MQDTTKRKFFSANLDIILFTKQTVVRTFDFSSSITAALAELRAEITHQVILTFL